MYKNFEEFKTKIRPYYGSGTFTKNPKLASWLIEYHDKKEKEDKITELQKQLDAHWKNTEEERKRTHSGKLYEKFLEGK